MAKGNIALGKFRGKVGGQVLRVDAGIGQIISEYNPHPSNPRTMAQTLQRGKMNLAGQISKNIPRFALVGLNTNSRKARSKFVSKLLKSITAPESLVPGTPANFKLNFTDLVFCDGVRSGLAATGSVDVGAVTVSMNDANGANNLIGGIAIFIGTTDGVNVIAEAKVMTMNNHVASATFAVDLGGFGSGYGYVVPIVSNEEGVIAAYGEIQHLLEQGQDYFAAAVLASLVQSGVYRHSEITSELRS